MSKEIKITPNRIKQSIDDLLDERNNFYQSLLDIKEYIEKFNVFERFSFPLMKKWEENQVKSSIDYEFNTTLKKDLLDIVNKALGDKE